VSLLRPPGYGGQAGVRSENRRQMKDEKYCGLGSGFAQIVVVVVLDAVVFLSISRTRTTTNMRTS
jgi:hypothetical protein